MILVTGATGHIGNTLVRALIQRNEKVRALILPDEDPISLRGLPVELVRGDVTDYSSLYAACEGIKIVYHIAGIISIGIGKRRLLQHVNVEGSRNVICACKEQSNGHQFDAGSSSRGLGCGDTSSNRRYWTL